MPPGQFQASRDPGHRGNQAQACKLTYGAAWWPPTTTPKLEPRLSQSPDLTIPHVFKNEGRAREERRRSERRNFIYVAQKYILDLHSYICPFSRIDVRFVIVAAVKYSPPWAQTPRKYILAHGRKKGGIGHCKAILRLQICSWEDADASCQPPPSPPAHPPPAGSRETGSDPHM